MKIRRFKKVIIGGLFAMTSVATAAGVAPVLINNALQSSQSVGSQNNSNSASKVTSIKTSSESYSLSVEKVDSTEDNKDAATAEYKIKINNASTTEGKVEFVKDDGTKVDELTFKPGDTLKVVMTLNAGYEKYTVRDLNVRGSSQNVWIPSKNDPNNKNQFLIEMPKYENTLDLEGKSSIYEVGTPFTITPTFIQESIGVDNNKVDWVHGAFADSLNGYVYDMSSDLTWSSLKSDLLYKTFENKEITNPIDVYIYLHGHNLTLDKELIDLGIQSGWSIYIYNNKTDSKDANNGYGEIVVPENTLAKVDVKGSIVLGGAVKWKFIPSVDGIKFISYSDTSWIGAQSNDPVQRLGE